MKRLILFLLASTLLFAAQLRAADSPKASSKPTIIVFISDDHGMLDSTPYGSRDARTPNMQRLADAGMTFNRAFIASPACAPSRAAMITGLMPARNGAEANHTFKRDGIVSLPETLRAAGYETAAFGKVAHGPKDVGRHGFDHTDPDHRAAAVEEYLSKRDAKKPLCLFVGTHSPHVPWPENDGYDAAKVTLPAKFVDTPETRIQRTQYLSAVTQADTDLGSIRELAQKHFKAADTLFIYTSDHGAQWPFGKWNLYDSGIRVPFLAAWPGVIKAGSRSDAIIQWTDILPTLIEVAGSTVPEGIDGRSFAKVLRDAAAGHRTEIFTTHSGDGDKNVYPIRALRTGEFKYILNLLPENAHTTHIDRGAGAGDGWRYFDEWVAAGKSDKTAAKSVHDYHQRPGEELYDVRSDPDELDNLASDPKHAAQLAQMRAQLEAWMKALGDQRTVFDKPHAIGEPYPSRSAESAAPRKKDR